jgi:hypothetical protein
MRSARYFKNLYATYLPHLFGFLHSGHIQRRPYAVIEVHHLTFSEYNGRNHPNCSIFFLKIFPFFVAGVLLD